LHSKLGFSAFYRDLPRDQLQNVTTLGTKGAFAAILSDGNLVTWGHKDYGADSKFAQQLQLL